MFRNILVPLDAFPVAERALPLAIDIARACRARLHLVHVMDYLTMPPYARTMAPRDWWSGKGGTLARGYVEGLAEQARNSGIREVMTSVRSSAVVPALMRELRDQNIDLVVMGTHGRNAIGRLWLGSVADPLMRDAVCPIIIKRFPAVSAGESNTQLRHILVPLDGSQLAESAISPAVDLAVAVGARITFLHVVRNTPANAPVFVFGADASALPDHVLADPEERQPQRYLQQIIDREQARVANLAAAVVLQAAGIATDISTYASDNDVDLIAIATLGRSGVKRMIFGSATEYLIGHVDMPLLVVPPVSAEQQPDAAALSQ